MAQNEGTRAPVRFTDSSSTIYNNSWIILLSNLLGIIVEVKQVSVRMIQKIFLARMLVVVLPSRDVAVNEFSAFTWRHRGHFGVQYNSQKGLFGIDSIIMQNVSDILPLFRTSTRPSHRMRENQ